MIYEAFEDILNTPDWRVEASDPEGEGIVYIALFSGPNAKQRAQEYAAWKNNPQLFEENQKLRLALGIATRRAVEYGDRLIKAGQADMNRGQFLAVVENVLPDWKKW